MNWFVIAIIAVVIVIVLLSRKTSSDKERREDYLQEMKSFLDGPLEALAGYENSYRIPFLYKGRAFEFLDIEEPGFKSLERKAFLKIKTSVDLTINMTERARDTVRSGIVQVSELSNRINNVVETPEKLKRFEISTNNINKVNELFANDKIVDIFGKFMSIDRRGQPIMALKIQDGVITLEFYSDVALAPNLYDLKHNVSSLEGYLARLLILVEAVERRNR
ncbi:MAG: hypothetical protein WC552_03845 [Candidatus Omnitrophota bacterium]